MLPYNAAVAQFSPGELSRAHQNLEGTQNCTKCHDIGKEIIGTKCLGCHTEISRQIENKHGYHSTLISEACVKCHKEHLGRDAKTTLFQENTFDHNQTGFVLTGGHKQVTCERCHTSASIKDSTVVVMLKAHPHKTFLGLNEECKSCHQDVHNGRFTQSCSFCHTTSTWKDVTKFDHIKTKFPLIGKHLETKCEKCHTAFSTIVKQEKFDFTTKSFTDCTPCHATPHGAKFANQTCQSCHTPNGWKEPVKKGFDHNLTEFKLIGKHATVKCAQCHTKIVNDKPVEKLHMAFQKCINCHVDKHEGVFAAKFANDCTLCHTEQGFTPSTFKPTRHDESHFPLKGAHAATLCLACHKNTRTDKLVFYFDNLQCTTCHNDPHKGIFKKTMGNTGCLTCHSNDQWKTISYDHAVTKFPLNGKHSRIACVDCHKQFTTQDVKLETASADKRCESCHQDIHHGQFTKAEKTECKNCHGEEDWHKLNFDHETQSNFSLAGGHAKLVCSACHRREISGGAEFIRFKPLAAKCESCHQSAIN
ncbi:MAG: cytochrome C [Bacteroidota bacterium]